MADRSRERELCFCHQCENEWYRVGHDLTCPECHSEIVEIIDADSDPRAERETPPIIPEQTHPNFDPFHDHNPWNEGPPRDAPDPDEGDISRVEWVGPRGARFTQTTFSSSGPGGSVTRVTGGNGPPMGFDAFAPILQSLFGPTPMHGPGRPTQDDQQRRSPLQEGPTMRGNFRIHTTFGNAGATTHSVGMDDIHGILSGFLGGPMGPGRNRTDDDPGGDAVPGFPFLFSSLFNPANARMGDAVFSNEALDRVISQLMEQHGGSTAPGPASETAINALPKIEITKEQQDNNGKAECSICMDSAELGAVVTQLPCKHWFHENCVGAWLREHDTCPQCRRGIMPKEGDQNTPRATGEAPRHWQIPDQLRRQNSGGIQGNGTPSSPYQIPSSPEPGPSGSPTRTREIRGGIASGIAGWMGRFAGRHNSSSGNDNERAGEGGSGSSDYGRQ